jgi:hypothetical protein
VWRPRDEGHHDGYRIHAQRQGRVGIDPVTLDAPAAPP